MKQSDMHEIIAEKLFVCGADAECMMELFRREEALENEAENEPVLTSMGRKNQGTRADLFKRLKGE